MITREDVFELKRKFTEWANTQEQHQFMGIMVVDIMIEATVKKYDELDCWETPEAQKELGAMKRSIHKIMEGLC